MEGERPLQRLRQSTSRRLGTDNSCGSQFWFFTVASIKAMPGASLFEDTATRYYVSKNYEEENNYDYEGLMVVSLFIV